MNKFAVLIGNSQFPDETDKRKLPDLACPQQDVEGLSQVLVSERGEFKALTLINKPHYEVLRELQRKVKQAEPEDLLLIYYSGHGKPNKAGVLHLTTFDTVIAELETSSIPVNRIYDILGTGKCKKIVIILDCCYSGAAGQGFKGGTDDQLQQLNNSRGTYLVTASTELQVAHENAAEGYSLFTKYLISGLETGDADKDGDGWIGMDELYEYIHAHVLAENSTQQPTKHVKEERGALFIAKSGRKPQTEKIDAARSTINLIMELNTIMKTCAEQNSLGDMFHLVCVKYMDAMEIDNMYIAIYDEDSNTISFPFFCQKNKKSMYQLGRLGMGEQNILLKLESHF